MKIERVSENQLKLTLTRTDLTERNLRLEDLISPSAKTQKLFRDIMEQALAEYDFIEENAPLMVEASPLGMDGLIIIVTKIDSNADDSNNMHMFPADKLMKQWKKKGLETERAPKPVSTELLIYSFQALDDVISISGELDGEFMGESTLYKNNGRFFLVLQENHSTEEGTRILEAQLEEYGQKHISTDLAKSYLVEHGELMIAKKALPSLAVACGK